MLTYLGCSIPYQFSNDIEFKLAKFLQLVGTIKRTIFKKFRTETILKIYNTLVSPTFLYGVDKKNQLDVTFCILYFSSNSCSTCFGQPFAHHQELTTA